MKKMINLSYLLLLFKRNLSFSSNIVILIFTFYLFNSCFCDVKSKLTNYQSLLCADIHCNEPIADGITTIRYPSPDQNLLSFKKDLNVKIFGQTSDKIYYFAEVNKKRGFVPAKLIKETTIHFDENKLNNVKFDFNEYEKSLNNNNNNNNNVENNILNDSSIVLNSSNNLDNDDSNQQSNTATPFVYSPKITVIDGTTIDEELLGGITATPSPTFVQNPVTKTTTIEANFTNVNELNQDNILNQQNESELNKEHGSLLKQLNEPIIQENKITSSNDDNVDDVTIVSEDSSTENVIDNEPLNNQINKLVDDQENKEKINDNDSNNTENDLKIETQNNLTSTIPEESVEEKNSVENNAESIELKQNEIDIELNVEDKTNSINETTHNNVTQVETEIVMNKNISQNDDFLKNQHEQTEDNINPLDHKDIDNTAADSAIDKSIEQPVLHSSVEDINLQINNNDHHHQKKETEKEEKISEDNRQKITNFHPHENLQTNPNVVSNQETPIINQNFSKTNNDDQLIQPNIQHQQQQQQQPTVDINTEQVKTKQLPPHLRSKLIKRSAPDSESKNFIDQNNPSPLKQHHSDDIHHQQQQQQQQQVDPIPKSDQTSNNINSNDKYQHQFPTSNFHAEGSVLNSKHKSFIEQKNIPQAPSNSINDINHINNNNNNNNNKANQINSVVSENILVNPVIHHSEQYQHQQFVNNNILKRKLLTERVGFVSVIMEIIPDEVELFFESFNISLHAIIFTSIVAFFWCLMKIFISFISSTKKVRELQDKICQTQRKLYYFEAEKDKIKENYILCRDESLNYKDNIHRMEKRRYQLEQENDKLKNELMNLKKDNSSLKTQADSNPIINSKLEQISNELNKYKQENQELNLKIIELEKQNEINVSIIKEKEKISCLDLEEIDNLNEQIGMLNEDIEKHKETIKELEKQFNLVRSENTNLKETQYKLSEEIKEMKDELLSSKEKCKNFENDCKSLEIELKTANEKLSSNLKEIEMKNSEISSMQTLLNKLNKNIKENVRQRRSTDLNGDVNGNDVVVDQDNNNNIDDNEQNDDTICLQDVIQLQIRLTQLESEKEQYRQKYENEQKQLKDINDEIESIRKINQKLKEDAEKATQEKFKAVTELEVLSKYYKEKELEYAKDIGVHKVKQEQQDEDVESLSSELTVCREENAILKNQVKSIKKELEETERRLKSQMNQLEKNSHENWMAARSAERKLEETKAEASALRQTLLQSVKSPPPGDLSFGGYLDETASSVSSLPEGLNTSLPVPPPPPPPFPFPFAAAIPPPPIPENLFEINEQHAAVTNPYWNPSSSAVTSQPIITPIVHQAQSSISSNTSNTYAFDPAKNIPPPVVSTDLTMTYPQVNPLTHQQQQQQQPPLQQPQNATHGSTSNLNLQQSQSLPSNQNIHQQQFSNPNNSFGSNYASGSHEQQHPFHSSQLDLSRNTYSPAISQLSTHTPLTSAPINPSTTNYDMQRTSSVSSMQHNPYPHPHGLNPPPPPVQQQQQQQSQQHQPNPFSVNYSTTGYTQHQHQQQQQHPSIHSPPTHDYYLNSHHNQLYNNNGQQQPVIDSNNPLSYSLSTTSGTAATNYTNQSSRPQSVHNQIV